MGLNHLQKQNINKKIVDLYRLRLANKSRDLITDEGEYILDVHPSRSCLIGSLGSLQDPDFKGPQPHNNLGIIQLVKPDKNGKITVSISGQFDLTYRVIPNFQEQNSSLIYDQDRLRDTHQLRQAFKRYSVQFDSAVISFNIDDLPPSHIWMSADDRISEKLDELKDKLSSDDRVLGKFKLNDRGYASQTLKTNEEFINQEELNNNVRSEMLSDKDDLFTYDVRLQARCRKAPSRMAKGKDLYILEVYLINASARENANQYGLELPYLLDARFSTTLTEGTREKMSKTLAAAHYRHDSDILLSGYGIHCVIQELNDKTLMTEAMPVYAQPFVDTPNPEERGMCFSPQFKELSENPLLFLKDFLAALDRYRDDAWALRLKKLSSESEQLYEEAKKDFDHYVNEVDRIKDGVRLLETYPKLMHAFRLMNESMYKATKVEGKPFGSWRLFQIGFILTQLRGIFERLENSTLYDGADWNSADVLWFATGGGKTEAYFGMIITALLYQRMLGQNYGTCAWIRYPLRMLTAQQFQRLSFVLAQAEKLRVHHKLGGHPFTIGYFTGSGTPNKITEIDGEYFLGSFTPEKLKSLQFISVCPYCDPNERVGVTVKIENKSARIKHVCLNKNCWSNSVSPLGDYGEGTRGEIGIYVSDEECYRYLPSVMVGTLDKLAVVGMNKRCSAFMGSSTHFCPDHGFNEGGKCAHYHLTSDVDSTVVQCENNSRTSKIRTVTIPPMKDKGVAYFLQDELHLLRENLGNFDASYESLWCQLQVANGGKPPKVVAATATINAYEHHIHHLHMRRARRFPAAGPELNVSFYAMPRFEGIEALHRRLHIALLPIIPAQTVNRAAALAALRWQLLIDEVVDRLSSGDEDMCNAIDIQYGEKDEVISYIRRYLSAGLMYANKKADIDDLTRFYRENCSLFEVEDHLRRLDGETPLEDIQDAIRHVETCEEGSKDRTMVATSVVSHGVDMRRLNFLTLSGWPSSHAEYLQVSARSGRVEPGVVVNVMSYVQVFQQHLFSGFSEYLQWQDVLVESVPINRIAPNILPRTLPGIICGFIVNWGRLQPGWGEELNFSYSKLHKELNKPGSKCRQELIGEIKAALNISGSLISDAFDKRVVEDFENQLDALLKRVFTRLENGSALWLDNTRNMQITDVMEEILGHRPFRSLRDIEQQISIKPFNEQEEKILSAIGR